VAAVLIGLWGQKHTAHLCVRVCVCVRERERERVMRVMLKGIMGIVQFCRPADRNVLSIIWSLIMTTENSKTTEFIQR